MQYEIIKNRGVLKECAPFILDEKKPLIFDFDNLPDGDYMLCLKRQNSGDREIVVQAKKKTTVSAAVLKAGIYSVELKKVENDFITDCIICAPLVVNTLASMNKGLIVYPEMDEVINRLCDLERQVAQLTEWVESVKDKIHEHNIRL